MEFPRGTVCVLLRDRYSVEPKFEKDCLSKWKEFDDFFIIRILQKFVAL